MRCCRRGAGVAVLCWLLGSLAWAPAGRPDMSVVQLPEAMLQRDAPLVEALQRRRSVRAYAPRALDLQQVAQLLWAAQGCNDPAGLRTAPSAGALYPLELLLVAGDVSGLESGLYRYRPASHSLETLQRGDLRAGMADAAFSQRWLADSPALLVITAIYERTTGKYGTRGRRYVHIEVGHAAQNALLQAAALGLGAAVVGAFEDSVVAGLLGLPGGEQPLYLLPVGWPAAAR